MSNDRIFWIEAQSGGPVTVSTPAPLYPLTFTHDLPSERHFIRHPAAPEAITDAVLSRAYLGMAEQTTRPDGTTCHTWTLPVSAPTWTFAAPLAAAFRPLLHRFLREMGPPDPVWQPTAFHALATRTTARHQRRNKRGRHKHG